MAIEDYPDMLDDEDFSDREFDMPLSGTTNLKRVIETIMEQKRLKSQLDDIFDEGCHSRGGDTSGSRRTGYKAGDAL